MNKAITSKQLNLALGIRPSPTENAKVEKQPNGRQIDFLFIFLFYSFFKYELGEKRFMTD